MGKLKQGISDIGIRTGNTIATPIRIGGELVNAIGNVPRQAISSGKNTYEVQKQTRDALMHNFLNFSKVEGKWYEKMVKVPANLVSAVTRRPVMIAGASIGSTLNQGVRQPFKKLLYTPGKMFKGMRNATRIFSKKKGFDFQTYDTHETTGDTRVNKIKNFGFLGSKGGASNSAESNKSKAESPKNEDKKIEKVEPKVEEKKIGKPVESVKKEEKKAEDKKPEKTETKPGPKLDTSDKPTSLDELKKKHKEESEAKDKKEESARERKNLDPKFQAQYKKEFTTMLNSKMTKEGVLERGKKNKKGETIEEIVTTLRKDDYPEFAGYIEDEMLDKKEYKQAA